MKGIRYVINRIKKYFGRGETTEDGERTLRMRGLRQQRFWESIAVAIGRLRPEARPYQGGEDERL